MMPSMRLAKVTESPSSKRVTGEVGAVGLQEAVAEDAQDGGAFELELGEVAEDPQAELGAAALEAEVGDVEEEGGAARVGRALGEVDAQELVVAGGLQAREVGGVGAPLLQLDGGALRAAAAGAAAAGGGALVGAEAVVHRHHGGGLGLGGHRRGAVRGRGLRALYNGLLSTAVIASHGLLDAMTDGGLGVALLWPISNHRYFAPWRPIPVAPIGARMLSGRGLEVVTTELLYFLPLLIYALWPRRRTEAAEAVSPESNL